MTPLPSESDELVALSALQHLIFCERQAALIHVERVWREDAATAEGRVLHERADLPGVVQTKSVRVARSVDLRCHRLHIAGRADVVEYRPDDTLPNGWRPFPVEYKRGSAKHKLADKVQLCAQALCLEEMHACEVPRGALFYGASHRRMEVDFDSTLRAQTESAAMRMHALISEGVVPRVAMMPKCKSCSLLALCLPDVTGPGERSRSLLDELFREARP